MFIRDSLGGLIGKQSDIYVMRWRFHPVHETGTGQCVARGSTIDQAMARFETWLTANPNRNDHPPFTKGEDLG